MIVNQCGKIKEILAEGSALGNNLCEIEICENINSNVQAFVSPDR